MIMRRNLAVLGALGALAVGCSSGTPAGHVDAGGSPIDADHVDAGNSPIDAGAQHFFDGGPWPLDGGGSIQSLTLSTNDLAFDPKRGVLYATTNLAPDAGTVLSIDPASATVTGALPVGGIPGVLAISDDASALYVGINTPAAPPTPFPGTDGGDSVRRIDLASMTAGPLVSLGSNDISKLTAGRIVAVPGSSTRYVVSLRQPGVTPDFAGLALYDGNTLLSQLDAFYGSGDSITFVDPSTLFGCSNDQEPSELIEYSVTTAITPVSGAKVSGLLTGGQGTRITFNGGWIFANDGQTVSAKTFALVGTYNDSIIARFSNAAAVPDPDGADVWFLRTADPSSAALLDFDRTTFQLRRTISLAPLTVDSDLGNATAFVQWSPTGFAFKTYSKVYLMTAAN
jgi:hypothetical protein